MVQDWNGAGLEWCRIGRVKDWKGVGLEECRIGRVGAGAGGVAGKRGDELVGGMVGDGGQVPVLRIVDVLRGELAVPARLPPERPAGEELVAEAVVGAPARGAAALHGLSLRLGLKQIQLLGS